MKISGIGSTLCCTDANMTPQWRGFALSSFVASALRRRAASVDNVTSVLLLLLLQYPHRPASSCRWMIGRFSLSLANSTTRKREKNPDVCPYSQKLLNTRIAGFWFPKWLLVIFCVLKCEGYVLFFSILLLLTHGNWSIIAQIRQKKRLKKREMHDVYKIKHFEMRVKATKNIFSVHLWIQPCLKIQKWNC